STSLRGDRGRSTHSFRPFRGGAKLSPRRPALCAVQHAVDPHVIRPHCIDHDVRGTRNDQFAGSRDAPRTTAARVIREARDARRNFVGKRIGGTWVALPIYSSCASRLRSAARSQTILTGLAEASPSWCAQHGAPSISARPL